MVEQFQRILEQIIIPQYEGVDDVDVSQFGMDNNFLKVTYYINDNLNPTDARKLIEETESLYRMFRNQERRFHRIIQERKRLGTMGLDD
jgi:Cdc6-like AAA superfamily ATPase